MGAKGERLPCGWESVEALRKGGAGKDIHLKMLGEALHALHTVSGQSNNCVSKTCLVSESALIHTLKVFALGSRPECFYDFSAR